MSAAARASLGRMSGALRRGTVVAIDTLYLRTVTTPMSMDAPRDGALASNPCWDEDCRV